MTIEKAAVKWWDGKRPVIYSKKEHLQNPTVNCIGLAEHDLALCVAEFLKKKKRGAK